MNNNYTLISYSNNSYIPSITPELCQIPIGEVQQLMEEWAKPFQQNLVSRLQQAASRFFNQASTYFFSKPDAFQLKKQQQEGHQTIEAYQRQCHRLVQEIASIHPSYGDIGVAKLLTQQASSISRTLIDLSYQPTLQPLDSQTLEAWLENIETQQGKLQQLQQRLDQLKETEWQQAWNNPQVSHLTNMLNKSPIDTSSRWLLHVLGDAFGQNTEYEGNTPQKTFKNALQIVRQWSDLHHDALSKARFEKLLEGAIECQSFIDTGDAKVFSDYLRSKLEKLQPKERFLFNGAWTGAPAGHAIYYEAERQLDGRFIFRTYNSGLGLHYHPSQLVGEKIKYRTFVEKHNVPLENIVNQQVLQAIIEIQKYKIDPANNIAAEWNAEDIYERILVAIGGDPAPSQTLSLEEFQTPQRAGTCSWRGLLAVFHKHFVDNFSLSNYKRFVFELELKTLYDHLKSYQNSLLPSFLQEEEELVLFEKSIQHFARHLLSYRKKGIITDPELELANTIVHKINHFLRQARLNIEESRLSQAATVHPVKLIQTPVDAKLPSSRSLLLQQGKTAPIPSKPLLSLDKWSLAPATLTDDLTQIHAACLTAYQEGEQPALIRFVQELFNKLPVPGLDDLRPLLALPVSQRQELVRQISSLIDLLFKSTFSPKEGRRVQAQSVIAVMQALALTEELAVDLLSGSFMPLNLIDEDLSFFLNNESLFFVSFDPVADAKINALKRHRERKQGIPSFFGNKFDREFSISSSQPPYAFPALQFAYTHLSSQPSSDPSLSIQERMKDAYIDPNRKTLPSLFYELRELAFIGHFLARRAFIHADKPVEPLRPIYAYEAHKTNKFPETWDVLWRLPYASKDAMSDYYYCSQKGSLCSNEEKMAPSIDRDEVLNIALDSQFSNTFLYSIKREKNEDRFSSTLDLLRILARKGRKNHFDVMDENKVSRWASYLHSDVSHQEWKDLLGLRTDTKLQVSRTLAYFYAHPHRLSNKEYQTLLLLNLFSPGLLIDALAEHPALAQQLNKFIRTNVAKHVKNNDIEMVRFFLDLNDKLLPYIQLVPEARAMATQFLNSYQQWHEISARQGLSEKEQALINLGLLTHLGAQSALDPQQAEEFVRALFSFRQGEGLLTLLPYEEMQVSAAIHKHRHALREHILNYPELLGRAISSFAPSTTWQPYDHFPLFSNPEGSLIVDVTQGRFIQGGKLFAFLPIEIRQHNLYEKVFKDPPKKVHLLQKDTYEIEDSQGRLCRLSLNGNDLILQYELEKGVWFELIPELNESDNRDLSSAYLRENYTGWRRIGVQTGATEAYLLDKDGEARLKVIRHQGLGDPTPYFRGSIPINKIVSMDEKGEPSLQLQNIYSQPFFLTTFLENFELLPYCHLWANSLGEPKIVEFPRFSQEGKGLQFEIKGEPKKLWCESYPGYFLAEKQYVEALSGFNHYLLLEKGTKNLLLIPRLRWKKQDNGSLSSRLALDHDFSSSTRHYFTYEIDPRSKKVIPQTNEGRLFLAYLQLGLQHYEEALSLLRNHGSQPSRFSKMEIEILEWIMASEKLNGNKDVRALSVNLAAQSLLMQDPSDYKIPSGPLYEQYSNLQANAGISALLPEEKRTVAYPLFRPSTWTLPTSIKSINSKWLIKQLCEDKPHSLTLRSTFGSKCKSFLEDYRMARESINPFERQELEKKLILTSSCIVGSHLSQSCPNINLLFLAILQHPDQFPDYQTMKKLFSQLEYTAETLLNGIVETANMILQQEPQVDDASSLAVMPAATDNDSAPSPLRPFDRALLERPSYPAKSEEISLALPAAKNECLVVDISPEEMSQQAKNQQELKALFSTTFTHDPLLTREFSRLKEECDTFFSLPIKQKRIFSLNALPALKETLTPQVMEEEAKLQQEQWEILRQLNQLPRELSQRLQEKLSREGRLKAPATIDDAILLFLRKDVEGFLKVNPQLKDQEIVSLYHALSHYLQRSIKVQKLTRLLGLAEQLSAQAKKDKEGSLALIQMQENLADEILDERRYVAAERPEYLVFEHYSGFLIRKANLEKLEQFRQHSPEAYLGLFLELIMGSGKSAVLYPLLGLVHANGDQLSMGVVPEPLFESMLNDLTSTSGKAFRQAIKTLEIKDSQSFSNERLQKLLAFLQDIRTQKQFLLMKSRSFQALELIYFRFLDTFDPSKAEQVEQLALWREIRQLIRNKGSLLVDEADQILNPRQELIFTQSEKVPLKAERLDLVASLYRVILSDEDLTRLLLPEVSKVKGGELFIEERYHAETKVKLGKAIFGALLSPDSPLPEKVKLSLERMSDGHKQKLLRYLLEGEEEELVIQLKDKSLKDTLALLKWQLNTLLPMTLQKSCDEHFGLSHSSNEKLAIPYKRANMPNEGSRFGNPYEEVNYTVQTYLKKGIPLDQLKEFVLSLRAQAETEMRDQDIGLSDTKANKKFRELVGEGSSLHLFKIEGSFWEILQERVNSRPLSKLTFIRDCILPLAAFYPERWRANPQIFGRRLARVQGFTGTLWNGGTFPEQLKPFPEKGIEGKTLELLWKARQPVIPTIASTSLDSMLNEMVNYMEGPSESRALIDVGALFKDFPNIEVAQALLRLKPLQHLKGIVFYANNEKVFLARGAKEPISFSKAEATFSKEERFTYYDQAHTTGADITQALQARAILPLHRNSFTRDLFQGAWRMRGLDKLQQVKLMVPLEVQQLIHTTLEKKDNTPLTLEDLIAFIARNQVHQQASDNQLAMKQRLHSHLQMTFLELLDDLYLDPTATKEIFTGAKQLFQTQVSDSPFEQMGGKEKWKNSQTVMEEEIERLLSPPFLHWIENHPLLKEKIDVPTLKERLRRSINYEILPPTMPSHQTVELEQQVTVEVEENQQVQQNVQTQTQTETQTATDFIEQPSIHHSGFHFQKGDLYTPSYFENILTPYSSSPEEKRNPIMGLQTALKHSSLWKEGWNPRIFDPSIKMSLNFWVYPGKWEEDWNQAQPKPGSRLFIKPLGTYQKPVDEILVIKNKVTGKIELLLLDHHDATFFKQALVTDRQNTNEHKELQLALYDIRLGIVQQGQEEIHGLEENVDFQRMLVQIKFLNGEVNYNQTQQGILRDWIQMHGPKMMQELFENILEAKERSRVRFKHSPIKKIFDELTSPTEEKESSNDASSTTSSAKGIFQKTGLALAAIAGICGGAMLIRKVKKNGSQTLHNKMKAAIAEIKMRVGF